MNQSRFAEHRGESGWRLWLACGVILARGCRFHVPAEKKVLDDGASALKQKKTPKARVISCDMVVCR